MYDTVRSWLYWGVEQELNYTLKRKVLHCNVAALLALGSMLCYALLFLLIGNSGLLKIIFVQMLFYPLLLLIPWLNRQGRLALARWALAFSAIGSQLLAVACVWGSFNSAHYYFILFAVIPIMFFPVEQWLQVMSLFVINVVIYLFFEFHQIPADEALSGLSETIITLLRGTLATTSLLSLLFFVWMSELIAVRNERKLERMSVTDPLTELPNRRFFEILLQQEFVKGQRDKQALALVMLDVDHFKRINDEHGHDTGDAVLRHLAKQMRAATRGGNLLARVGGEEFALLLPDTALSEAIEVAQRIRQTVEQGSFPYQHQLLRLTVSAGVARVKYDAPLKDACQQADRALYAAKGAGRNCVASFDS